MARLLFKTISLLVVVLYLSISSLAAGGDETAKATRTLPDKIGNFRARSAATVVGSTSAATAPAATKVTRIYADANGDIFEVTLARTQNDSGAYALLTTEKPAGTEVKLGGIGTASIVESGGINFVKGNAYVRIVNLSKSPDADQLTTLANSLAQQLDKGENDIPVLVRHLPNWESAQPRALYVVTFDALRNLFPQHRVLEAIEFEGGAEAVKADYDAGKLLIIEFNTPQISADNERAVAARINELRATGEPPNMLASAYRRVGNYLVFMFDAPSPQVANELIDQVKYQQVVQWLGDDPYAYERATREFTDTTLGVFVSVVKASGLALLTCVAVGGLFGAILFSRRRAQQRNVQAYSDAGGMLRLNLDEMTPKTDPARLLGPGAR